MIINFLCAWVAMYTASHWGIPWGADLMGLDLEPGEILFCISGLAAAWYEWRAQARNREDVVDFKQAAELLTAQQDALSSNQEAMQAQFTELAVEVMQQIGKMDGRLEAMECDE